MRLIKKRNILIITLIFMLFIARGAYAEFVRAIEAEGEWVKGIIKQREAIYVDEPFVNAEVEISVPQSGKYQLIAYVYHNWNTNAPGLYVEAHDSAGTIHRGYHVIESIWYLGDKPKGRWFFVSLSENPYWELPAGDVLVKFWVRGQKSPWENEEVPLEGMVAVESLFLVPVLETAQETVIPWLVHAEHGKGNWNTITYHDHYSTNLISSHNPDSVYSYAVKIPVAAYYQVIISVLSHGQNTLKIDVVHGRDKEELNLQLHGNEEWQLHSVKNIYLEAGTYEIVLKSEGSEEINIDFIMLLPSLTALDDG